jgi:hypothetical protein
MQCFLWSGETEVKIIGIGGAFNVLSSHTPDALLFNLPLNGAVAS